MNEAIGSNVRENVSQLINNPVQKYYNGTLQKEYKDVVHVIFDKQKVEIIECLR